MFAETTTATKFMRKDLKEAFPGVKFSVRKNSSSWYDSVHVSYDSVKVSTKEVRNLLDKYKGYKFNGMTDNHDPQEPVVVDGEEYSFPIGHVSVTNRAR